MRMRAKIAIAVFVTLTGRSVAADPVADAPSPAHFNSPRLACREADTTSCVRLPGGYWVNEDWWSAHDAEMHRLQDAETSLTAQNKSLRASASGWQPGWKTLAVTLATGIGVGFYLNSKL